MAARRRAAQYVRMSTEHQTYSTEHQTVVNTAYALTAGYEIVRTYADHGISGVTLARRLGLKALLSDVVAGGCGFEVVLVYDVSRWGRFQDLDESGHYEFICRQAGVRIEYTAEPFANDGSLSATIIKHLKRAMAAEYSRELSVKVSRAQAGLRARGYWTGGPCGLGLRRQIVEPDGRRGPVLERHEHKALQRQRIVLVHGPRPEVETVRRVFRLCAHEGMRPQRISELLNAEAVPAEHGGVWTACRIRALLRNERYIGNLVGGRQTYQLARRTTQPAEAWVRIEGAVPPIVSPEDFKAAQASLQINKRKVSDEALIGELRRVLAKRGRLSHILIKQDPEAHCPEVYKRRFGGLLEAYRRAGVQPTDAQRRAATLASTHAPWDRRRLRSPRTEADLVEQLRVLLRAKGALSVALINDSPACANAEVYRVALGGMRRAYALAGYTPSAAQEWAMQAHAGQTIDRAAAAALAAQVQEAVATGG